MKARKHIVFTLLAILLLSTFACGGGGEEEATPTPTATLTLTVTPTPSNGAEGALPTIRLGDRWVYSGTSDSYRDTWTLEATDQEMIGGKDCYVLDISIDPPLEGLITGAKVWYEKATLRELRMQVSQEYMGFPYVASLDTSYQGPPLYPLEVGKEVEIILTETSTLTMLGETETETERHTYRYKVEKIEDISVPAGTFRCFKIVVYDEFGSAVGTTWYSDKVKSARGVKAIDHEDGDTFELQSYSVQ